MHDLEGEINYNWPKSKECQPQVGTNFINVRVGIIAVCFKYIQW